MSGSGRLYGVAGVGIVSVQIVSRYGSCVGIGYHFDALVVVAAALVVGIRAECAVAAVCDFADVKIVSFWRFV